MKNCSEVMIGLLQSRKTGPAARDSETFPGSGDGNSLRFNVRDQAGTGFENGNSSKIPAHEWVHRWHTNSAALAPAENFISCSWLQNGDARRVALRKSGIRQYKIIREGSEGHANVRNYVYGS